MKTVENSPVKLSPVAGVDPSHNRIVARVRARARRKGDHVLMSRGDRAALSETAEIQSETHM